MSTWIWLLMPLCALTLFGMWFLLGRDKKTVPVIAVRPPAELDPLEMEYAQIATISDRGIYAMLLYWVSKGILEIVETGEHAPGVDGEIEPAEHTGGRKDAEHAAARGGHKPRVGVRRLGQLPDDAPEHARFLFQGMFGEKDLVWLDCLPAAVADHKDVLCEKVKERFNGKDAVVEDDSMLPTLCAMFLLIAVVFYIEVTVDAGVFLPAFLGLVLFCGLCLLQNGALGFRSKYDTFEVVAGSILTGLVFLAHLYLVAVHTGSTAFTAVFGACFLLCIPCIMFMERRTNHKLYGQILGFRQYIETAEWEKLKALSEGDPGYGMELLPYAMLFGMGTRWTKLFENKAIYHAVASMEEMAEEE